MRILLIAAHPDDVEVGLGCLALKLGERNEIHYLVLSDAKEVEGNRNILNELDESAKKLNATVIHGFFPNMCFENRKDAVRQRIYDEIKNFTPTIIFMPSLSDIHQDHHVAAETTINVARTQTVFSYEVPHSCRNFKPNTYYPITEQQLQLKLELIHCYRSQTHKSYVGDEAVKAAAAFRGLEAGFRFAEAFEMVRGVMNVG